LISDGRPTDDRSFETAIDSLNSLRLGRRAIRLAVAIGADARLDVLDKFISESGVKPFQADNPESVLRFIEESICEDRFLPILKIPDPDDEHSLRDTSLHEESSMGKLLKPGQMVKLGVSQTECRVEELLGEDTRGQVYRADLGGNPVVLKWYFPEYLTVDVKLHERIKIAI